jgi:hypothetical protein
MVHGRVEAGAQMAKLEVQADLAAFWPNTDVLPPEQRQRFLDREQRVTLEATMQVDGALPPNADVARPLAALTPLAQGKQVIEIAELPLQILASGDARRMYLREWTLDPQSGAWRIAHSSGWIGYTEHFTWTLSAGQGVKYVGVWVADAANNVSALTEASLTFVNLVDGAQTLADGERVQYRGFVERGAWALVRLTTLAGDPDLYIWRPRNAFRPDLSAEATIAIGQWEEAGARSALNSGYYVLEARAVGASQYNLALVASGVVTAAAADRAGGGKERPPHPLTLSDPLSAGVAEIIIVAPPGRVRLPIISAQ